MTAPNGEALRAAIDRTLQSGRPLVAQLLLDALAPSLPISRRALMQARIHMAQHLPAQARLALDHAMAMSAEPSPALLVARARAWLAEAKPEQALQDAARAVAAMPSDPEAAGFYATLLMEQGAFSTAVAVVRRAVERGAADAALHTVLALALLCMNNPQAAADVIDAGLAAFPGHADLRHLADKRQDRCRAPRTTQPGAPPCGSIAA